MNERNKVLTASEWKKLWEPLSPDASENKSMRLSEYAQKLTTYKNSHPELTPSQWSNERYEIYIENLLATGASVSDEIFATVPPNANMFRDCPLVGARQARLQTA